MKKAPKPNSEIIRIASEAKAAGISYGKYVNMLNNQKRTEHEHSHTEAKMKKAREELKNESTD